MYNIKIDTKYIAYLFLFSVLFVITISLVTYPVIARIQINTAHVVPLMLRSNSLLNSCHSNTFKSIIEWHEWNYFYLCLENFLCCIFIYHFDAYCMNHNSVASQSSPIFNTEHFFLFLPHVPSSTYYWHERTCFYTSSTHILSSMLLLCQKMFHHGIQTSEAFWIGAVFTRINSLRYQLGYVMASIIKYFTRWWSYDYSSTFWQK